MACSCTKKSQFSYEWTDGITTLVYSTEIQAKAKVLRAGGTYKPVPRVTKV